MPYLRWMLRAAYFAQELLSTFSTAIGEVALIPATGGLFQIHLTYSPVGHTGAPPSDAPQQVLIWDRKTEGGFPETKILKQKIRDYIQPARNLGHSDTPSTNLDQPGQDRSAPSAPAQTKVQGSTDSQARVECEDCK